MIKLPHLTCRVKSVKFIMEEVTETRCIEYRSIIIFIIWMIMSVHTNNAFACVLCSSGFGWTTGTVSPILLLAI